MIIDFSILSIEQRIITIPSTTSITKWSGKSTQILVIYNTPRLPLVVYFYTISTSKKISLLYSPKKCNIEWLKKYHWYRNVRLTLYIPIIFTPVNRSLSILSIPYLLNNLYSIKAIQGLILANLYTQFNKKIKDKYIFNNFSLLCIYI